MAPKDDFPILPFATPAAWETWLEVNHADAAGVWLKIAKAGTGIASITYAQALDGALCYGWIDGQKRAADDTYWLQRFTPRTPRSKWSKVNCHKVEALITDGRMQAAGSRQIAMAKADGRWAAAYDSQSTATVPPDLARALNASLDARDFFATLDSVNRYAILYRIQDAKKPETRAKRIASFVEMLTAGRTVYPLKSKTVSPPPSEPTTG